LQVSIAVFSDTVEKFVGQRWLSPLGKLTRTPMGEARSGAGVGEPDVLPNALWHHTGLGRNQTAGVTSDNNRLSH